MRHLRKFKKPVVKRNRLRKLDSYRSEIVSMYYDGIPQTVLAADFGVSRKTINRMIRESK